jgi:hypothetical protein
MRAAMGILAALAAAAALATEIAAIAPFSAAPPGDELPAGWSVRELPGKTAPEYTLVRDGATTVLRVRSKSAAGSAIHRMSAETNAGARLTWRWKVERALEKSELGTRHGDDFAARVYVSFDVPLETLSFAARTKLRLARLIYGDDVPGAAICYLWDNRNAPGTGMWSPFTDRLWMIVLESGNARAGQWVPESRDVAADFRAAFGATWQGAPPRIIGVALASDTDNTGESVTAWYGDLKLEAAP